MERHRTLHTSRRSSVVPLSPAVAWDVVASGTDTRQWYADAAPFVFRGALDRLLPGAERRSRPPGRTRLATGDRVGFWDVVLAEDADRRLVLQARVRAPGTVTMEAGVSPDPTGSRIDLAITFWPTGLLGRAYLVTDLPARAVVIELAMLDLLTVLRRRLDPGDNQSGASSVEQV